MRILRSFICLHGFSHRRVAQTAQRMLRIDSPYENTEFEISGSKTLSFPWVESGRKTADARWDSVVCSKLHKELEAADIARRMGHSLSFYLLR
jgi:hypothetical protein